MKEVKKTNVKKSSNQKKKTETKNVNRPKKKTETKNANSQKNRKQTTKKTNTTKNISTKVEPKQQVKQKKLEGPDLKELEYEIKKDIKKNSTKTKIIFLIILLIVLIGLFISLHLITPKIKLVGPSSIEIPYDGTYIENGAVASYFGEDLTNKIQITNNINTNKIGTYEVIYIVDYHLYQIKKTRIVQVVDKKTPIITLEGETEVNVCPNKEFKEIGYKATDEYDGDITEKVKIKKEENQVTYTVKDSSGNTHSITRKINKVDKDSPVITLKGNKTMYLTPTASFTEPGYTAIDNCNDDLTSKVTVSGTVKEKQEGTYTLTYQVTDNSNNKTTVTRKVIISEKTNPNSGIYSKGTIYLTFDDGPSNVTTGVILDILKEENVKATFFVTNNGPDYLIKRIYDEGHTVAIHTASHNYSNIYSSVDNYFSDLEKVSNRIKKITGQTSKIVRFPGGSSNTISRRYSKGIMTKLSDELFSRGYRYYDWNIDSGDASTAKTKKAVYNNVVNNLSKDKMNVVLMHDIKAPTREAVRDIIKYGKENGYTFDRIDMDTYMVRQKIQN